MLYVRFGLIFESKLRKIFEVAEGGTSSSTSSGHIIVTRQIWNLQVKLEIALHLFSSFLESHHSHSHLSNKGPDKSKRNEKLV